MPSPVPSTPRVARPANLPASPVIALILLHLIFVLEIVVANFKVLHLWFSHPALRIQSFPLWSPMIEAEFVIFTLCVFGLSAAKPWSWWLALFLDGLASLLHLFYFPWFFLRPFSSDSALTLMEYLLDAVALFLLFFPIVLGHYSVDRFIAGRPAFRSAVARISFPAMDKIITRFIAAAQFLFALFLLLWTLFYLIFLVPLGILGLVLLLFGLASAGFLFTLRTAPRIACAIWQALFVAYYLFWAAHVNAADVTSPANRFDAYLAAYSCLSILYLLASFLHLRSQPAPGTPSLKGVQG